MACEPRQLTVQAARVLDHLQALREYYGEDLTRTEPELAEALEQAVNALAGYVSRAEIAPLGAAVGTES